MRFISKQIKGHGRGKKIGVPTINLEIPEGLIVEDGVYASTVVIDDRKFMGALHIGPVPTFGQKQKSIEVYIIDADKDTFPQTEGKAIAVEVVKRIRSIENFPSTEKLVERIIKDVEEIKEALQSI